MTIIAALILPSCAGWTIRADFGYKDISAGVELTPPDKGGKSPVGYAK